MARAWGASLLAVVPVEDRHCPGLTEGDVEMIVIDLQGFEQPIRVFFRTPKPGVFHQSIDVQILVRFRTRHAEGVNVVLEAELRIRRLRDESLEGTVMHRVDDSGDDLGH